MIQVAVDGSALHSPRSGIGRYLTSLLGRIMRLDDAGRWIVYARRNDSTLRSAIAGTSAIVHSDRLPIDLGRIISLFTMQAWWAHRQCPDVFWGPAHRLPIALPERTARVVTVHDLCWLHAPQTMRASTRALDAWLMPRALHSADRIITASQAVAMELRAAFPVVSERVVVVPEAAEALPPPMPFERLAARGVHSPFVLFVGTTEPRKNLARLIEAFSRLPMPLRQSTQLVIVGGRGWGGVDAVRLAETHGIAERICVLGAVDDVLLATLYLHSRCLALPSLYEGFGLPLLEAMAIGTPVLTSTSGAMAEVVGRAGLLIDPMDVDAICGGLHRLLADDGERALLGERGRVRAREFSWDAAARQTLDVLRDAVDVRRAGAAR